MVDIVKAEKVFKEYLKKYDQEDIKIKAKIKHTYGVMEASEYLSRALNLSEEDVELAKLIALLHDIGRFEQSRIGCRIYDEAEANMNHAEFGVKVLFEENLIRDFIEDNSYDSIIYKAIENHNKLSLDEEKDLNERELLHSKIIRDADKLDNFRVKKEEKIEAIFPGKVKKKEDLEDSTITDIVFETVKKQKCVDIHDRVTPLDYWVCVLAFIFDLNFKETYQIVKENDYINILIDRFKYKDLETKSRMEDIRNILNSFIDSKIR